MISHPEKQNYLIKSLESLSVITDVCSIKLNNRLKEINILQYSMNQN